MGGVPGSLSIGHGGRPCAGQGTTSSRTTRPTRVRRGLVGRAIAGHAAVALANAHLTAVRAALDAAWSTTAAPGPDRGTPGGTAAGRVITGSAGGIVTG